MLFERSGKGGRGRVELIPEAGDPTYTQSHNAVHSSRRRRFNDQLHLASGDSNDSPPVNKTSWLYLYPVQRSCLESSALKKPLGWEVKNLQESKTNSSCRLICFPAGFQVQICLFVKEKNKPLYISLCVVVSMVKERTQNNPRRVEFLWSPIVHVAPTCLFEEMLFWSGGSWTKCRNKVICISTWP